MDQPATVDEYIAQFPSDIQEILVKIRAAIKETAPQAEEKISFHMPAYEFHGRVVYFAVNKRHIGFYPRTTGMDAAVPGLSAYKGTKSSIHFPLNKPMPYDLIREIVRYRVAENLSG